MAIQHTQNIKKVEIIHDKELKERQEAFQEAFQNDLQEYQTQGHIARMYNKFAIKTKTILSNIFLGIQVPSLQQVVSLEDIVLEQDDSDLLDQFLNQ